MVVAVVVVVVLLVVMVVVVVVGVVMVVVVVGVGGTGLGLVTFKQGCCTCTITKAIRFKAVDLFCVFWFNFILPESHYSLVHM